MQEKYSWIIATKSDYWMLYVTLNISNFTQTVRGLKRGKDKESLFYVRSLKQSSD